MKPILTLVTLIPCIAFAGNWTDATWTSQVPMPDVLESDLGQYFLLEGSSNSGRPGDPSLPMVPVLVILPAGAVADSVTVESTGPVSLPGTYDVKAIQAGVPLSRPDDFAVTPRNPEAYSADWSPGTATLQGQGGLMGLNVAELALRPVEWDPASGEAVFHRTISVTVHHHPGETPVSPLARGPEGVRTVTDIAGTMTLNPDAIPLQAVTEIPAAELPWGEYLIITPAALVASFEPLAEFKTLKGIPARIVTVEYITDMYTGVDAAQEIRFFLRDIYDDSPPTWVLLGGDTPGVPHRNCWATAEGYVGDPAADIYYQDMNDTAVGADSWDANSNGIWGEISGDIMDYHPDYLIGRASVETTTQADIFVEKVLEYEGASFNDTRDTDPWYTSMGFTTEVLWSSPYCPGSAGKEKVDTLYTQVQFQPIVKHYESAGTQGYGPTMEMLNAGMHFVNHAGHGSTGSVSIGSGSLDTGDFMGLTNISSSGRVSIWNTLACNSGGYDQGTCLAEAWIRSPGGGGFCMMNTRYGWGEPTEPGGRWSDLVDQEFFAKLFTEDVYHLGEAHALAWDEFIPLIPTDTHYDWIAKSITLFGDPELPMWLHPPDGALEIGSPAGLGVGSNTFAVNVDDASGPVNDARVCIMQGDWDSPVLYEVDYTDGSGQVTVTVTVTDDTDTVYLTAWGRDHSPLTVEIPVSATGVSGTSDPLQPVSISATPNPANSTAMISWSTPYAGVTVSVRDLTGRVLGSTEEIQPGSGSFIWDLRAESGERVPSGLYFVTLEAAGYGSLTSQLVVLGQ